jgi:NADPH:quinone reductase-like Zn-dependent oxidoreductase
MKAGAIAMIAAAASAAVSAMLAAAPALPDTMLAAAIDQGGGPEVLTVHHMPVPRPKAGEVLVAVRAAGVGAWESEMRKDPGSAAKFPLVLGGDGAGTVAAIGPGVRQFQVGDQVYGTAEAFYAEYVAVRAENLAPVPKGVGFPEAGILAISGLSALQGIDDVLQLKAGETLIIHGATGGVGTLAVQFAKRRGIRVLATASSEEGLALVRRLGADAVVNGRSGDILAAARQFAPDGVDAVLGLVGGTELEQCIDALRKDGRGRVAYLSGMTPLPRPRFNFRMTLYSFIAGSREFGQLNRIVGAGRTEVPVAAEFPLADAAGAHRRLEAGHLLGKIVLRIQ